MYVASRIWKEIAAIKKPKSSGATKWKDSLVTQVSPALPLLQLGVGESSLNPQCLKLKDYPAVGLALSATLVTSTQRVLYAFLHPVHKQTWTGRGDGEKLGRQPALILVRPQPHHACKYCHFNSAQHCYTPCTHANIDLFAFTCWGAGWHWVGRSKKSPCLHGGIGMRLPRDVYANQHAEQTVQPRDVVGLSMLESSAVDGAQLGRALIRRRPVEEVGRLHHHSGCCVVPMGQSWVRTAAEGTGMGCGICCRWAQRKAGVVDVGLEQGWLVAPVCLATLYSGFILVIGLQWWK